MTRARRALAAALLTCVGVRCASMLGIEAYEQVGTPGGAGGDSGSEAGSGGAGGSEAGSGGLGVPPCDPPCIGDAVCVQHQCVSAASGDGGAAVTSPGDGGTSGGDPSAGTTTLGGGPTGTPTTSSTSSTTGSSCDDPCSKGQTCQEGSCQCPEDEPDWCSASCTNVLTDSDHCGRCNHSCHGYSCQGGNCEPFTLASDRTAPWALGVNGDGVYWLEEDAVRAVALNGGNVVTLASEAYVAGPASIAVSSTTVYYTNRSGTGIADFDYAVMAVPAIGGGNPTVFAKAYEESAPAGVAYLNGVVYWVDHFLVEILGADEDDGSNVFGVQESPGPTIIGYDIAVDETNVYFGSALDDYLFQRALEGGSLVILQTGQSSTPLTYRLASAGGYVYWTTGDPWDPRTTTPANSTLAKIPIGGGDVKPVAWGLAVTPAVAADASGVYWSDGNINRTSHDGATVEVLADGKNAGFIALDDDFVYWTDATSGTVMKVAK